MTLFWEGSLSIHPPSRERTVSSPSLSPTAARRPPGHGHLRVLALSDCPPVGRGWFCQPRPRTVTGGGGGGTKPLRGGSPAPSAAPVLPCGRVKFTLSPLFLPVGCFRSRKTRRGAGGGRRSGAGPAPEGGGGGESGDDGGAGGGRRAGGGSAAAAEGAGGAAGGAGSGAAPVPLQGEVGEREPEPVPAPHYAPVTPLWTQPFPKLRARPVPPVPFSHSRS